MLQRAVTGNDMRAARQLEKKLYAPLLTVMTASTVKPIDFIRDTAAAPEPAGAENYALDTALLDLLSDTPKSAKGVVRLVGETVADLLYHLPCGAIERVACGEGESLADKAGETVTFELVVTGMSAPRNPRAPIKISGLTTGGELVNLVYFNGAGDFLQRILPVGARRLISGKVELYNNVIQVTHPDYALPPEKKSELPELEPVYPLTAGVLNKTVVSALAKVKDKIPDFPEWIDPTILPKFENLSRRAAFYRIHSPQALEDVEPSAPARRRIAYDSVLAHQLLLALTRQNVMISRPALLFEGGTADKLLAALPFALTGDQQSVITQIRDDLVKPQRMSRLLQGDVGSGKTLVALFAASFVIEAGGQVALMAPTEILARQHLESLTPLCEKVGIRLGLLTGKDKASVAKKTRADLANGEIDLLIGTHALIEDTVRFPNLGLAIIDEQHRFGVEQRLALADKGVSGAPAHILVMSATPIPRTLALTRYGDTDISILKEKPPGRKPIDTRLISAERLEETVAAVGRKLAGGERVYWVCPLVAESEKSDLAAAEARFEGLAECFPGRVGLVHGRMKAPEKEEVMRQFKSGEIALLIATTVIEVGVNVPEATVMVIEGAERFGLSQLHQLRGRVGRGAGASVCLLLYNAPLTKSGTARLETLRKSEDGFYLAEQDLKLRGAGEILGAKQAGFPDLKGFDPQCHQDLIPLARDDVRSFMYKDPLLMTERGQALRYALELFYPVDAKKYYLGA